MPGDPGKILVSMGIYVFNTKTLIRRLVEDAKIKSSAHDFGKDIIPRMVKAQQGHNISIQGYHGQWLLA